MSKTYKKTPIIKDNKNGRKFAKRLANKKVRKFRGDIPNGNGYKKLYCSYDIYDYISFVPYKEFREMYNDPFCRNLYGWNKEEDCYQEWAKMFLYK